MNTLLNTLGDAAGWLMDTTGSVTMAVFFTVLALLVLAVPLYAVYAVVSSLRPRHGRDA